MDKTVPRFYKVYGEYINQFRAIPGFDGLKPVERRILLSAYEIAKDKFVKSARLDGHVIGHYHPHSSCYGTIVQLANQGWLLKQGNFGTSTGIEPVGPAAARYTEIKLNYKSLEKCFDLVNYVDWIPGEYNNVKEPASFPVQYPLCLVGGEAYTQGIGFAFKTLIPRYHQKDLYQRLLWLLGKRKSKPIFSPVTNCEVLSKNSDLDKLLQTGKGSVIFRGKTKLHSNGTLSLYSWPLNTRFQSILNKISDLNVGFQDLSAGDKTEVVFKVLQKRNSQKILNKLITRIEEATTKSINFNTIICELDGKLNEISIDDWLLKTYKRYKDTLKKFLKSQIAKKQEKLKMLKIIALIQKHIKKLDFSTTVQECTQMLSKWTKLPHDDVYAIVNKKTLANIINADTDTKRINTDVEQLKHQLQNIDEYTIQKYKK